MCTAARLTLDSSLEPVPTTGCNAITGEHCLHQCKQARGEKSSCKPTGANPCIPTFSQGPHKGFLLFVPSKATLSHAWANEQKAKTSNCLFSLLFGLLVSLLQMQSSSYWARWKPRLEREGFCSANMDGWLSFWAYNERKRKRKPLHGKFYSS